MPKNKRQHFNAQSHLRRFADEHGHLQIINVDTGEVENDRHPRSVGMESYFYGRVDRALRERGFKFIEDDAITWMDEIQRTEELPSRGSAGHVVITMWTAIQHGRTRAGREAVNKAIRMLGSNPEKIDGTAMLSSIWSGMEFPHMYDLSYILIKVTGDKHLWIGDNPVIRVNPWLERKGIGNGHGTAWWDRGLCVVLPVTKRLAVVWYDGIVYKAPAQDSKKIEFQNDVTDWLNARQIGSSSSECYCSRNTDVQPSIIKQWRTETKPMPRTMLDLSERWNDFERKCRQTKVDTFDIQKLVSGNVRQRRLFLLAEEFKKKVEAGEVEVGDWGVWFESNRNNAR